MKQSKMKKQVVFTVLLVLLSQWVFAQVKTDTIEYKKDWLGYNWIKYDGKKLNKMREFRPIMKTDSIASRYLFRAQQKHRIGAIFVTSGLICLIAADIGFYSHLKNNSFAYSSAYIGFGLLALSIPFTGSAKHNFKKAIRKYNSDVRMTGYNERKPQLYFSYTGCAMGVGLRF